MHDEDGSFVNTQEIDVKLEISKKLKFWRGTYNLSQRRLSKISGVSAKTIWRIEDVNSKFIPSLSTIIRLANALRINFSWLLIDFSKED